MSMMRRAKADEASSAPIDGAHIVEGGRGAHTREDGTEHRLVGDLAQLREERTTSRAEFALQD